jgi:PleD family two-component response regulator
VLLDGHALVVTASVGVAAGGAGTGCDDIIGAADAALYRAKNSGRNRVEAAEPDDWPPDALGARRSRAGS